MPKTLLGKFLFQFIGCAACTTLILDGLSCYGYCKDYLEKKKSEISEGDNDNEVVCEDPDRIDCSNAR